MINEHYELLEQVGLDFFFAGVFFFIAMAIRDVLIQGNVPPFGRKIVWFVLFLGCMGFVSKGMIQIFWQQVGVS